MNGDTNGHSMFSNGASLNEQSAGEGSATLQRIHEALNIVHSPYSSNDSRQQASRYLDEVKADEQAPFHGFTLATDKSQQPEVRHYALSLLEHAIKHKWSDYSSEQAGILRQWVLELAQAIAEEDPTYLRTKTAQLWAEIAKRTWAAEWTDMDELLVRLWEIPQGTIHKEFVLFILETLSDDVFNGEDTVAALREGVLSKACVEIFTPAEVLTESFPNRERGASVRYGEEGWLSRIGELLRHCLAMDPAANLQYQGCAVRILAVYKSVMPWAIPKAISHTSCVQRICESLQVPSPRLQLAAVESLHALYCRVHFSDQEFLDLVCPMYTSEAVDLLRKLYEWSVVSYDDIDDEKYRFAKKFSEMISNLGGFIEQKVSSIPENCDLPRLLDLLLAIAKDQSFLVSIPVLVTWTRLLRLDTIGSSPTVTPLIPPLLELCSSRLIRYESLPEDTEDPSLILLVEDLDTLPERHAFLGNYRRYCSMIIELVVRQKQSEALYYILGQVEQSLQQLYVGQAPFSAVGYSKASMPVLQVDRHFTVIEAALKGYMKWRSSHGSKPQEDEQTRISMEDTFESWCGRLLEMNFEDPIIRKRILQLAVAFSTTALDKKNHYMLKVLEHILMSTPAEYPDQPAYSDAVKELHTDSMYELQRLATKMPDQLLEVYEQLEAKVNEIISSGALDRKRQTSYQTFLFTIIHRATSIDPEVRLAKLRNFVAPVEGLWQNPEMNQAILSFDGFCELLGLNKVMNYLVSRRADSIEDWGLYQLDAEGQEIQKELDERVKALPLRTTKSFLGCSTDKIEKDNPAYEVTCMLWQGSLPAILPNLLNFLSQAHAFHNPANWTGLPTEMRPLVGRILTDRFWQAGISTGSKDDFYARVTGTKSTMEGFASSIRGSVRAVREACYAILWCMSRLDMQFYGFEELPGPLSHALFANAHCLSAHQFIALLNVVRYMVEDCPVELRTHFVPPLLAACFEQMDAKCSSEWEQLGQKQRGLIDGENLTQEMKEESILRQLTHAAVMMIGAFLDPARPNPGTVPTTAKDASSYIPESNSVGAPPSAYPSLRKFCLSSPTILEPLLMFMTHAIQMRDTRCCGVVLRVFRSIVPDFTSKSDPVAVTIREHMSEKVLEACIYSLHESYFVDLQRDIAQLISSILIYYSPLTPTPRNLLLRLPGIQEPAVDKCIDYMSRPGQQQRQQRALVLDLLRDLKGVSVSEQGRITKSAKTVRKEISKMQQEFLTEHPEPKESGRLPSPDLEGVAAMLS
ncbi:hypothetical protein BP6252_09397 [Coleophoma cylindrospora]|uniref:Exportin-5 C-terminal domain-containing protein n=1 Tax=Coleophoma cylindrospora TaxID=1849047 RepID=A0A3D8R253_9HELO|nr:hypothetical protein BP6252_09397 [Coleophoma cylindrospora]